MTEFIVPRAASIGALSIQRILPYRARRAVGPFVFLDEMGPVEFGPGEGIDVPPHPHIGLSTLTYLFDGALVHRDSIGVTQAVEPGAVNWMTAGHGVTHSERSSDADRARELRMHGVQAWVALLPEHASLDPSFQHVRADDVPSWSEDHVDLRLIAGSALGRTSPLELRSPLFYIEARWRDTGSIRLQPTLGQRGVYSLAGEIKLGEQALQPHVLGIADDGDDMVVRGDRGAHAMFLGGPALPREPFMHWNYVAWTEDEIEVAKRRWADQEFPMVSDA